MPPTISDQPGPARLWEIDHPFYAEEGNFYSNDCANECESWQEFLDDMGDSDPDLNLLYRWDWDTPDPDDYEADEEVPGEALLLFFVGQRKAILMSWRVIVTRDDEPAIRAWLTERSKTITAVWSPISLTSPVEKN